MLDIPATPIENAILTEEIPESCTIKLAEGIVAPKDAPQEFPLLTGLEPDPTTSSHTVTAAKESVSTATVDDVPAIGILAMFLFSKKWLHHGQIVHLVQCWDK